MKVRNGFVSNSSSSSFLIYGINIKRLDDVLSDQKFLEYVKNNSSEYDQNNPDWLEDVYLEDVIYDYFDSFSSPNTNDIKIECPYNGESGYYIGSQWSNVRDDQTGLQFKERIKRKIKRIFPNIEDKEFDTFSESWYS